MNQKVKSMRPPSLLALTGIHGIRRATRMQITAATTAYNPSWRKEEPRRTCVGNVTRLPAPAQEEPAVRSTAEVERREHPSGGRRAGHAPRPGGGEVRRREGLVAGLTGDDGAVHAHDRPLVL